DESVDDLVLLDGEGVEIDLLQAADLALLHKAAELRHWDPLLFLFASAGSASAAASTTVTASTAVTKSTTESAAASL
ncbi:hypothetical protein DVA78_20870, partial [Acinetobacter baumannii]